jgi:hypothetical protein
MTGNAMFASERIVYDYILPPKTGCIAFVASGESLRITDLAGLQVVVLAHRSDLLKSRCGLVTIDAFAGNGISALCDELAELRNLATIWAVHRTDRALRERTLRHHTTLQKLGRETHFMALPDPARSLAEQLTDSRDPLGRETRWLLDPVHSRTA